MRSPKKSLGRVFEWFRGLGKQAPRPIKRSKMDRHYVQ